MRPLCVNTQWINANDDNICDHCHRLVYFCFCIDDYVNYVFFFRQTAFEHRKAQQRCREMYSFELDEGLFN